MKINKKYKDLILPIGIILYVGVVLLLIDFNVVSLLIGAEILLVSMGVGCICGIVWFIVKAMENERKFKKFRSTLKVGDDTDMGEVLEIKDGIVTIAKKLPIDLVDPPKNI